MQLIDFSEVSLYINITLSTLMHLIHHGTCLTVLL